jgi:hypothetical protein
VNITVERLEKDTNNDKEVESKESSIGLSSNTLSACRRAGEMKKTPSAFFPGGKYKLNMGTL